MATLVYADEPQVVHLTVKTVPVIAVAIPDEDPARSSFLAATTSIPDWQDYLQGSADLRYLFTFPKTRQMYTFDLAKARGAVVTLEPFDGEVPEEWLPPHRFFSTSHTEDFEPIVSASHTEQLFVAGEWELQEFGRFYQRYSDIYAFIVALLNWADTSVQPGIRAAIRSAFEDRPFQGGSSYLHLFNDLFGSLRREERIGLDKMYYASPGVVEVNGRQQAFEAVNNSIGLYIERHQTVTNKYVELHRYLSGAGLLRLPGDQFKENDPFSGAVKERATELASLLPPLDFDIILPLCHGNVLVAAKVVLAYYRRLNEASSFFAQGRVALER